MLTVTGRLNTKRIWRSVKGRREHDRAGKGGGGRVREIFSRKIRRGYGDMTWREGLGGVGSCGEEYYGGKYILV